MGRGKKKASAPEAAVEKPKPSVEPAKPNVEPGVVTLLGALVVGTEIKPTGCSIRVSVLEKYGLNMEDLKNRGLV